MSIESIINDLIVREGGFVHDPRDRGGPTKYGVTQVVLSEWRGSPASVDDVKNLSDVEARNIYREGYLVQPGFLDAIPEPELLELVLDCAVNHGIRRTIQWLQKALAVTTDFERGVLGEDTRAALALQPMGQTYRRVLATRVRYYGRLITDSPTQARFAAGWANRAASFVEACPA